ncbi:hypothetical protein [Streptacidiphilus sp. P02-A3a]|uniref:hypothetical protein n=1 Tax=Streptacidiphilus sp. P02-A3a TaxID=2704468 RepID=UPI0015FCCEFF|nr:hypothetical protein [Streptacidiphilus sp. P02-A3a]QMU69590.1 hypothetical protein GXP74_16450 [Streptacidiphilus sp. P02-A3a]
MPRTTRASALAVVTTAAALGASIAAAPAAQAAVRPTAIARSAHVRPLTVWVNCSTVTEGEQGGQYYLQVSCSDVNATSWEFGMECSNSFWYYSGFSTTFENVQLYCPAGTSPVNDILYYTT